MIDQGIFSRVIILLILITYLLTVYGYCQEKIDLGHYWDLKEGLKNFSYGGGTFILPVFFYVLYFLSTFNLFTLKEC